MSDICQDHAFIGFSSLLQEGQLLLEFTLCASVQACAVDISVVTHASGSVLGVSLS